MLQEYGGVNVDLSWISHMLSELKLWFCCNAIHNQMKHARFIPVILQN